MKSSPDMPKFLTDTLSETRLEKVLRDSEACFRAIFDKAAIGIVMVDTQTGAVLDANPALEKILGYTKDELKKINLTDITFHEDISATLDRLAELRSNAREYDRLEKRYIRKDGKIIWVHMTTSLVKDTEGQGGFIFGMIEDITERKKTEEKLKWNESLLRLMAAASPLAFLIVDNRYDEILFFNQRFCSLWRLEELEKPMQNREIGYKEIIYYCTPLVKNPLEFLIAADELRSLDNEKVVEQEIELNDGKIIRHYSAQIRDEDGYYVGRLHIFEDITERKDMERSLAQAKLEAEKAKEEAERLADTDYLTGLYNRRAFINLLKRELERAQRKEETLSLILMDVDNFKLLNDTYGHLAGDAVLQEITQVLVQNLRSYDFLGRYGGEEFMICLPDTSGEQALAIGERIRQSIAETRIQLPDTETIIWATASLGISAWGPDKPRNPDLLIKNADLALYEAKKLGRNRVCMAKE